MKLASIVVLCLVVCIQQATAIGSLPLGGLADGIRSAGAAAQGAVDTAGSVASGVAGIAAVVPVVGPIASGVARTGISTATGIAKGVIGAGTDVAAGIASQASG